MRSSADLTVRRRRATLNRNVRPAIVTRDEFKTHVESSVEEAISGLEKMIDVPLPRVFAFQWGPGEQTHYVGPAAIEAIVAHLYVDSEHIWPCVTLAPSRILNDGKLLIIGLRAGYPPAPFQTNHSGREGPFILSYGGDFVETTRNKEGPPTMRAVIPRNLRRGSQRGEA